MKDLQNLPTDSETKTKIYKILSLAYLRNNKTPSCQEELDIIVDDVQSEFKDVKDVGLIIEGIKKGSLGHYGKVYNISSNTVCTWLRDHIEHVKEEWVKNKFKSLSKNAQLKKLLK